MKKQTCYFQKIFSHVTLTTWLWLRKACLIKRCWFFPKKIATIDFQFSAKLLHSLVLICFTRPICYFFSNEQTGIWSQLDIICPMTYEQVNYRRWKTKNLFVLPYISTFLVKRVFSASPLVPKKKVNQECKAYQRKAMQCKEEYNKADSIYVCNSGYWWIVRLYGSVSIFSLHKVGVFFFLFLFLIFFSIFLRSHF